MIEILEGLYDYLGSLPTPTKLDRYRDEEEFKECVKKSDYWRLMMLYGHDTLLLLLSEYEVAQKFEDCAKIKAAIEHHNNRLNDTLTTK